MCDSDRSPRASDRSLVVLGSEWYGTAFAVSQTRPPVRGCGVVAEEERPLHDHDDRVDLCGHSVLCFERRTASYWNGQSARVVGRWSSISDWTVAQSTGNSRPDSNCSTVSTDAPWWSRHAGRLARSNTTATSATRSSRALIRSATRSQSGSPPVSPGHDRSSSSSYWRSLARRSSDARCIADSAQVAPSLSAVRFSTVSSSVSVAASKSSTSSRNVVTRVSSSVTHVSNASSSTWSSSACA